MLILIELHLSTLLRPYIHLHRHTQSHSYGGSLANVIRMLNHEFE